MNPRACIIAILNNKKPDCVPVFPKIAFSNVIACPGMSVRQYMTDFRSMAEAAISAQRLFGWDAVALHTDIGSEGRALGSVYELPEHAPSHITEYLLKNLDEYEKVTIPDPHAAEPMKTVIEAVKLVKEQIGEEVFVSAWTNGPLNVASQLLSLDSCSLR